MSARRKRVISTEEIQFNHKPAKCYWPKKEGSQPKWPNPKYNWDLLILCRLLDRPVFERCQTLLHPELTPWWSFPLADGAHHKKPHSPTHPLDPNELSWLDKIKDLNYGEISMWKSMLVKGNFQACPLTGWQHIFVVHHISSPLDEMDAISHTTYSSAFSGMKSFVF